MKYSDKLKDPRWQRKRLEVMERDDFRCMCCHGDDVTLNVHHTYYVFDKDPWDYPTETLWTICQDCHPDMDEQRRMLQELSGGLCPEARNNLGAFLVVLRGLMFGDQILLLHRMRKEVEQTLAADSSR